ncbi:MAG: hypothetical protein CV087_23720 [Candidatus Brocadia sp. WS118]|nr:MAG: hypothetical protein CV087_23720 [Candidatus Brocadia sp. WS118]
MSFGGTQGAIRYTLVVDDSQATGKINNFKNALRGMDTSVNSSATGLGKINTAMTGLDSRTSKISQVMTGLKNNFGAITTSVGAAMSSVVNLNRAWQDLGDTQIAVDRTALKVSRTQEAVTKAQDKLNQLTTEGKQGTVEYEQAVTDLAQAEEAATLAVTMHGEALEDQQRTYENFYMNIFTTAISSVGTLGTSLQALESVGIPALSKITSAVKGLGLSLKTLSIGGAVGLAITGIILLAQNLMEARARTDELKKAIMDLSQQSIDLAFTAIKTSDIDAKRVALNALNKALIDLDANKPQRTFWDNFNSSGGEALDAWNQQRAKVVNDIGVLEKQLAQTNTAASTFNATMKQQAWQFGQVNIQMLNYQDMIAQTISQSKLQADASQKSADALEIARQMEAKLSIEIPLANARLGEQKEVVEDNTAAWDAYIGAIRSFSDEMRGLDKTGFKDFFKDLGFGKNTIKDLWKQNLKDLDFNDLFEDIRGSIMSFDKFTFDDGAISKWLSNLKKRIEKVIKSNPDSKPLAADLIGLADSKTAEEFKNKFVALLNKIKGDPALQKVAADLGINTSTDFATGMGQGFSKLDLSKYINFDSNGKATTKGNPLTGLITTMTKSIDQTVSYIEKAISGMKLKAPPIDQRQLTKSFANAIKSAESTQETIVTELQVKFPAVNLKEYTKSLGKAVDSAEATRKEIEKELQSEISIKVSFDVDDLPEYKTKTTSSGVKLVKTATGYQGWVRGGQGQMFMVAEAGEDEYVSITPKSKIAQGSITGSVGGGPIQITLNINGNDIIESRKIVKLIRDVTGRNTSRHT